MSQLLAIVALLIAPPRLMASTPPLATPVVSEDVPVPGGIVALAHAIGLEQVPDRARFVTELGRVVYTQSKESQQSGLD